MKRARWLGWLAVVAFVAAGCGGSDSGDDGTVIGIVPGGETTLAPESGSATTSAPTTSAPSGVECGADEVCRIEVPLTQIALDVTPASISLDGGNAWLAAPDDLSLVEVDLAGGVVVRSLSVAESPADVISGAGSLWVITYDFSFGPMLRVDPSDGSTVATVGDPSGDPQSRVVVDDAVWAVNDGYGRVLRVDLASNEVTDVVGGTDFGGSGGEVAIVAHDGALWAIDESTGSVERIDAASRSIESTFGDLGYAEEASGEFTSILSDGAKALAATSDGIWVLSDTLNPADEANVVGSGALFLLDHETGDVVRRIDLRLEPGFGRPGLAITDEAAWYLNFVDRYLVRVDLGTERQTFVSLGNAGAVGVVTDGTTVWLAVESMFESDWVVGIDVAAAAAATAALGG